MARTIAEIYESLNTVKQNMPELGVYVNNDAESMDTAKKLVNDVRTQSKVAIWRLWLWIMAVASWVVEKLQDNHEAKINRLIAIDKPHTLNWYASESLKFQYGHEIIWDGEIFRYEILDENAQIINHSAAAEVENIIKIKVLKNNKQILTEPELIAFTAFWSRWKDAGVNIQIVSELPNLVNFTATIYRNRNVVNEDNTLIANPDVNVVESVINSFTDSMQFDSILNFTELISAVKAQPGIKNMTIGVLQGENVELLPNWSLKTSSGFATINWAITNITYVDTYD